MIDQLPIRARSEGTAFNRRRCHSIRRLHRRGPLRIQRRARDLPDLADPLQPIPAMRGHRASVAQGFDDRFGKGSPRSIRSILCSSRSLAIVNSPTFEWSCWIWLSRRSASLCCKPDWPPAKKAARHWLNVGPPSLYTHATPTPDLPREEGGGRPPFYAWLKNDYCYLIFLA